MHIVPVQMRVVGFAEIFLHDPDPGCDVPCVQDADALALKERLEIVFGDVSAVTGVDRMG